MILPEEHFEYFLEKTQFNFIKDFRLFNGKQKVLEEKGTFCKFKSFWNFGLKKKFFEIVLQVSEFFFLFPETKKFNEKKIFFILKLLSFFHDFYSFLLDENRFLSLKIFEIVRPMK